MSDYTIKVDGHETGLTAKAVKVQVKDLFPDAEGVTVVETKADD